MLNHHLEVFQPTPKSVAQQKHSDFQPPEAERCYVGSNAGHQTWILRCLNVPHQLKTDTPEKFSLSLYSHSSFQVYLRNIVATITEKNEQK